MRKHIVDWSPKPQAEVDGIKNVITGMQAAQVAAVAIQAEVIEVADAENDSTG